MGSIENGEAGRTEAGISRRELAARELGFLMAQHIYVMAENEEYVVLKAMAGQIPNGLHEIGRLRQEGCTEGDGRGVDLDYFDLYYLHMVIFSKKTGEIAGACRIGQMDIILKRFGHDGLATGSLFRFSPTFVHETGPVLEVGKVFIREEYRGLYNPSALLWKGIGRFVSYNPHYRAIIGLGSVNETYDRLSQEMILSFLRKNRFIRKLASHIAPLDTEGDDGRYGGPESPRVRLKTTGALSYMISRIERDGKDIPPTVKHLLGFGGKIIAWRETRPPSGRLHLLFFIDIAKYSRSRLSRFLGHGGAERFLDYDHSGNRRAA